MQDTVLFDEWFLRGVLNLELLLDTCDAGEIKRIGEVLEIDGVTTNPTILTKAHRWVADAVADITQAMGEQVPIHVQAVGADYGGIMESALFLNQLRKNLYIKIPVTWDGLRAIRELAGQGVNVTATAVFTVHQGFLAAKSGAKYVAPYVNKLDNISGNGVGTVKQLIKVLDAYQLQTKVLAASFKNAQQVLELMVAGVHSATVTPEIAMAMAGHPLTDLCATEFFNDWKSAFSGRMPI